MIYTVRAITGAAAWVGNEENENFGTAASVRAKDEDEARAIAAAACGDEGSAPWFDPKQTTVTEEDPNGPSGCLVNA